MKFAANDYESKVFKSTDFHLIAKEFLAINGNYIAHHYNTKFGKRDSIVPYDKVDFFIITKAGCCTKRLLLIGDLNFAAQGKFSNGSMDQLLRYGKNSKLILWSRQRKSLSSKFLLRHKGKKETYANSAQRQNCLYAYWQRRNNFRDCKKLTSYKCKPIFSLFKRVATIEGYEETDMRTGTTASHTIIFPGVFFFCQFCCGKIKAACKALQK